MKNVLLGLLFVLLSFGIASAGALGGRIIRDDGKPLSKTSITIEGNQLTTNEFGGYKSELTDGERELSVKINNITYTTEKIKVFSPETKQNWRMDTKNKKLIKIR
jgi:hypothetical protein